MEHLQQVWNASRKYLPIRTPGSVIFGTCLCSAYWDQFSSTCRVFSRHFTWNIPQYFFDLSSLGSANLFFGCTLTILLCIHCQVRVDRRVKLSRLPVYLLYMGVNCVYFSLCYFVVYSLLC